MWFDPTSCTPCKNAYPSEMKAYVMANLDCRLVGAMGCSDIWSNIILGGSVRVFLDKINIRISKLGNADCSPQCGWAPTKQLKT